jgi:hypothetical protein
MVMMPVHLAAAAAAAAAQSTSELILEPILGCLKRCHLVGVLPNVRTLCSAAAHACSCNGALHCDQADMNAASQ